MKFQLMNFCSAVHKPLRCLTLWDKYVYELHMLNHNSKHRSMQILFIDIYAMYDHINT